jgi:hypothetical protein
VKGKKIAVTGARSGQVSIGAAGKCIDLPGVAIDFLSRPESILSNDTWG